MFFAITRKINLKKKKRSVETRSGRVERDGNNARSPRPPPSPARERQRAGARVSHIHILFRPENEVQFILTLTVEKYETKSSIIGACISQTG